MGRLIGSPQRAGAVGRAGMILCALAGVVAVCSAQPLFRPLGPPREIRGVLVEAGSGAPIAGAQVSLHWKFHWETVTRDPTLDRAVTGQDGTFLVRSPMPQGDPFRLHVEGKGVVEFITPRYETMPAQPIRLEAPATGGWIVGQVVTPEGKPMLDGWVYMCLSGTDSITLLLQNFRPDENGMFSIGPLAYDEYILYYYPPQAGDRSELVVARPIEASRAAETPVRIVGQAMDWVEVRVVDAKGSPVREGRVTLNGNTRQGSVRRGAELNPETLRRDAVRLYGTAPGRYVVSAQSQTGAGWTEFLIGDEPTSVTPSVTVTLRGGTARIAGQVSGADGLTSAERSLVLTVEFPPIGPSHLDGSIDTIVRFSADGRFESPALIPGKYRLGFYETQTYRGFNQHLELHDGETMRLDIPLQAKDLIRLKGYVVDTQRRPVAGAEVTSSQYGYPRGGPVRSGEDGAFEIGVQPTLAGTDRPMQVDLETNHLDYACPVLTKLEFMANQPPEVKVVLNPRTKIRVEFARADGVTSGQLAGRQDLYFTSKFMGRQLYNMMPAYHLDLDNPEKSAIPELDVPQGLRFSVGLLAGVAPKLRVAGEPVWLKNGQEVGRGQFTIPLDDAARYSARVALVPLAEAAETPTVYVRVTDYVTGKPIEGVVLLERISGGSTGRRTLPNGTFHGSLNPKEPIVSPRGALPITTSAGEIWNGGYPRYIQLPAGFQSSADSPLEIRALPAPDTPLRVQLHILDSLDSDITDHFIALDGDLQWRPMPDRNDTRGKSLIVFQTGGPVHRVVLTRGRGGISPMQIVRQPANVCSLVSGVNGAPTLQIDFDAGRGGGYLFDCTVQMTDVLLIPGLDD